MMAPPDCIFMRRGGKKQPAFVSYSGTYTTSEVTGTDGKKYTLYTLKSSGTLILANDAQFWMCGGGRNGGAAAKTSGSSPDPQGGYGGSGAYFTAGTLSQGTLVVTIGSAQSASKILLEDSTEIANADAGGSSAGASGGGGRGNTSNSSSGRKGTGESTYPFGIQSLNAHCPGGGGGGCVYLGLSMSSGKVYVKGGKGGTNGGDGGASTVGYASTNDAQVAGATGGTGGTKGGGKGGTANASSATSCKGGNASFYGGGGGGGAGYCSNRTSATGFNLGSGGTAYQGVVYLLDEIA